MFTKRKFALFPRSRALEAEIEEFLQKLSDSALTFQNAISAQGDIPRVWRQQPNTESACLHHGPQATLSHDHGTA